MRIRFVAILAVLGIVLLSGCWDGVYETVGGKDFDYERAMAVQKGMTAAQVAAAVGAPHLKQRRSDGTEQWTYTCILERKAGVDLGVRVSTSRHQRKREAVFQFRDGKVVEKSVEDQLL